MLVLGYRGVGVPAKGQKDLDWHADFTLPLLHNWIFDFGEQIKKLRSRISYAGVGPFRKNNTMKG